MAADGGMARARRWRVRPLRLMRTAAVGALGVWLLQGWLSSSAAWVAATLGPTDRVQWEEVLVAWPGRVVVIRLEKLLPAPEAGRVVPLVGEGESVATGTPLVRIEPPDPTRRGQVVSAPFSGVVSFLGDGWEEALSVASPQEATRVEARPGALRPLAPRGEVARGEPVVRLVDRRELFAVFEGGPGGIPRDLDAGDRVELVEGSAPAGIPAVVVERLLQRQGAARVMLRLERQPVDWLYRRVVPAVRVVAERHQGVVLPASALTTRRGRTGCWVATGGGPTFVEVQVVRAVGSRVVVRGVPDGARVYRWPRWLGGR